MMSKKYRIIHKEIQIRKFILFVAEIENVASTSAALTGFTCISHTNSPTSHPSSIKCTHNPVLFLRIIHTATAMSGGRLTQGLVSFPGIDYETKALAVRLLAEDRDKHHCFYGKAGFHNHLPHQ